MMKVTFRDLIIALTNNEKINANVTLSEVVENIFFVRFLDADLFSDIGVNVKSFVDADNEYNVFRKIYSKYYDDVIYYATSKIDTLVEEHQLKASKFMNKLLNKYQDVSDKYITLLTYYRNKQNELLDRVKSTANTVSRFNDTPQIEGDFIAEPYTSNISLAEVESSTDQNTLMMRLKEIQDHYKEVYSDFIKEFKRIFIVNMEE